MWICLNDAFLSIVRKDCGEGELLVRARREGDIEKVFGRRVVVTKYTKSDYLYRAVISKEDIAYAILQEIDRINYPNFKNSVLDKPLHDAYERVWATMAALQPLRPYSGGFNFDRPTKKSRKTKGNAR